MAEYIITDNGDAIGVRFPSDAELTYIIQDIEKLQLKVDKEIKFSNKKNWINSNKRRK